MEKRKRMSASLQRDSAEPAVKKEKGSPTKKALEEVVEPKQTFGTCDTEYVFCFLSHLPSARSFHANLSFLHPTGFSAAARMPTSVFVLVAETFARIAPSLLAALPISETSWKNLKRFVIKTRRLSCCEIFALVANTVDCTRGIRADQGSRGHFCAACHQRHEPLSPRCRDGPSLYLPRRYVFSSSLL